MTVYQKAVLQLLIAIAKNLARYNIDGLYTAIGYAEEHLSSNDVGTK